MDVPLIVTLKIDESSQYFFDALRKEHFPKHVNYLNAHCTLFHSLPSGETAINEMLALQCGHTRFTMKVNDIYNIGNGVVYSLQSGELQALHLDLQHKFKPWLNWQDSQPLKPHITIQNKVSSFKAIKLFEKLRSTFQPFEIRALGLSSWFYLKGPWEHVNDYHFSD